MTVDADIRTAVIHERGRNVVVVASAGTGKTTLIVDRIVNMVAPRDPAIAPTSLARIAAITFTRKAAAELRVRLRGCLQRHLRQTTGQGADGVRAGLLEAALADLDTAEIGTIHSFADRLLRRHPREAGLDPDYQLADDPGVLVREAIATLYQATEDGSLAERLSGSVVAARSDEARTTLALAVAAGILQWTPAEGGFRLGLDALLARMLETRDVEPAEPPQQDFAWDEYRRFADELAAQVSGLAPTSSGSRWLLQTAESVQDSLRLDDPAQIYAYVMEPLQRGPRGRAADAPRLKVEFADDRAGWEIWKAFDGDQRKVPVRDRALREDLRAPLGRWLAHRLVRLRPVIGELYENVKAAHQAVDHVDLLLRLRDVLRDDLEVRARCSAAFDHIFVDECQDTDPLQAEVLFFLTDHELVARSWTDVRPHPGRLTMVGDPKQAIYRFRRADLATFWDVRDRLRDGGALEATLVQSWRCSPSLASWTNRRFDELLGGPGGANTDNRYSPIVAARATDRQAAVHLLRASMPRGGTAHQVRADEARSLAAYVRWLVEDGDVEIEDPDTGALRRPRLSDLAVLAISTTTLPLLFAELDDGNVPYAARGGRLFVRDPLQRSLLLAMVAIADRDDGVAVAGLLRPPFFAIGLDDLAREDRTSAACPVRQAKEVVTALRWARFARSVGATGRALIEETGMGRDVIRGPNGRQRLRGLYELILQVEALALSQGLDYDAVIEQVRSWIDAPPLLDRPHPFEEEVVQVLTIHQAKGLEFPVVLLWDGAATWWDRGGGGGAWTVSRDGRDWAIAIHGLGWDEGRSATALRRAEQREFEQERRRLAYVATTRARDLVVLPWTGTSEGKVVWDTVGGAGDGAEVRILEPGFGAMVAEVVRERTTPPARIDEYVVSPELFAASASSHQMPRAFSSAETARSMWGKQGRFGVVFGSVVHAAIGRVLHGAGVDDAVGFAAARAGLRRHLPEVAGDVRRAVAALGTLGVGPEGRVPALEYAVAGLADDGALLAGYVDLVADIGDVTLVIDFKTDLEPDDVPDPMAPGRAGAYARQVRGYASVVSGARPGRQVRGGLLYTSSGGITWVC